RRFGGDPRAVGRTMVIDGETAQIVGVMPPSFAFPDDTVDLWKPLLIDAEALSANNRGSHSYEVVGRLKRGVTIAQSVADLAAATAAFKDQYPGNYRGGFSVTVR